MLVLLRKANNKKRPAFMPGMVVPPVMLALRRLRQEDGEFDVSLDYIVLPASVLQPAQWSYPTLEPEATT